MTHPFRFLTLLTGRHPPRVDSKQEDEKHLFRSLADGLERQLTEPRDAMAPKIRLPLADMMGRGW